MAITIDTLATVQDLEKAGIKSEHAKAIVKAVSQADANLVTKADLDAALAKLAERLTVRMLAFIAIANGILFAALRYLPPPA